MSNAPRIATVVLNWNGETDTLHCIEALQLQTAQHTIIAVDNGSVDGFVEKIEKDYSKIRLLKNTKNLGFAGGVNTGIRYAIQHGFEYVALINNDATPEKNWLEELITTADTDKTYGIVTGKLLKTDGFIDSTGDQYTIWGLAYPRGRNEADEGQYNVAEEVFAGSGGASLYRVKMLEQVGLFDEDFFAYYEDVDISFRARLAGWKVGYNPAAIAYHKVGASSGKIKGFTTYQTIKNLPWLFWKNVPLRLLPKMLPRFILAHGAIIFSALARKDFKPAIKGILISLLFMPKKLLQRNRIQNAARVEPVSIDHLLTHDLPPNATKLKQLRKVLRIKR